MRNAGLKKVVALFLVTALGGHTGLAGGRHSGVSCYFGMGSAECGVGDRRSVFGPRDEPPSSVETILDPS